MQLIDNQSQQILLSNVELASTLWARFSGLMFRKRFGQGYGLWVEPCRSVHTMWMRVVIDVYFIDDTGRIIEHRAGVRPWSIVMPRQRCQSVLEVPNAENTLAVGTQVRLQA